MEILQRMSSCSLWQTDKCCARRRPWSRGMRHTATSLPKTPRGPHRQDDTSLDTVRIRELRSAVIPTQTPSPPLQPWPPQDKSSSCAELLDGTFGSDSSTFQTDERSSSSGGVQASAKNKAAFTPNPTQAGRVLRPLSGGGVSRNQLHGSHHVILSHIICCVVLVSHLRDT